MDELVQSIRRQNRMLNIEGGIHPEFNASLYVAAHSNERR